MELIRGISRKNEMLVEIAHDILSFVTGYSWTTKVPSQIPLLDVGVAIGWCLEIDADSEAGTRVGPKFKFPPKSAREIPCRGERFCLESKFDLSVMLEKIVDTSDQFVRSLAHILLSSSARLTTITLEKFDKDLRLKSKLFIIYPEMK